MAAHDEETAGKEVAAGDPGRDADTVTWPRLSIPERAHLSPRQRAIHDQLVASFGAPVGPRIPLLFAPDLFEPWAALGRTLVASALPARLRELAILTTARFWGASFAWAVHEGRALAAGVGQETIADIKWGRDPGAAPADEQAVHAYCIELLALHHVPDGAYQRIRDLLGVAQQVELTVVIGHYSNVSLTLVAHDAPVPETIGTKLPDLSQREAG